MIKITFSFALIYKFIFVILGVCALSGFMTSAQATPQIMAQYAAPSCESCHTYDYFTKAEGLAGLATYLASKTPTCIAPQVLQNNICVTPTPTCVSPQVLQNNICVTPVATCTAPQVLQNNSCVTPSPSASIVRFQTSLGPIDISLYTTAAPLTVANFLSYVNSGAYNQSFIHRSVPKFIIQGGGYVIKGTSLNPITTNAPVINEYSTSRSNLRGTIAMAKLGNDPNSATSQWFFNLSDNSANLDNQNGGFTVFGKVLANGMSVVDSIAALPIASSLFPQLNCPSVPFAATALSDLPLAPPTPVVCSVQAPNLVTISTASSNQSSTVASDSDRVFAYLEAIYPQYIAPANTVSPTQAVSAISGAYYYRYYSGTNSYVATSNGTVYYLGSASGNQIYNLGSLSSWIATAIAAGY